MDSNKEQAAARNFFKSVKKPSLSRARKSVPCPSEGSPQSKADTDQLHVHVRKLEIMLR